MQVWSWAEALGAGCWWKNQVLIKICMGIGKYGREEGVKSINFKIIILGGGLVLIFILYWSIVEFWRRKWQPTPVFLPSCLLENPRDGGAWWAIIYGFTQSWTRLKWLSSIVELPFWLHVRNGIFPAISVNKDFTVISNCASPMWRGKPWGNPGCENTGYWPQIAPQDQRNDFREPRFLHLPIHRKALNSLTWHIWFSLVNSNPLMLNLKLQYIGHLKQRADALE